ncbi:hypothetical protein F4780DRAFT_607842 [Xylariomycetidae sp. FL0641]|nr:hypothetical protein F4780DRAFT_607842 [Xylariomycetidae sp. FL0641]
MRTCSASHPRCRERQAGEGWTPDRLLEIVAGEKSGTEYWRLVEKPTQRPRQYLSLKATVGESPGPEHLKLTRSTKLETSSNRRCQPGVCLGNTKTPSWITVELRFRYLWIDSLCIIQDDVEDWKEQSSVMGSVYKNAVCNIAATWTADVSEGCFAARNPDLKTPPRHISSSIAARWRRGSMPSAGGNCFPSRELMANRSGPEVGLSKNGS